MEIRILDNAALEKCSPKIKAFIKAIQKLPSEGFEDYADEDGYILTLYSSYRTIEEQLKEYRRGRRDVYHLEKDGLNYYTRGVGEAISTNALPFQSYHNYGLAVDLIMSRTGVPDPDFIKESGIYTLANKMELNWLYIYNPAEGAHFEEKLDIPINASKKYYEKVGARNYEYVSNEFWETENANYKFVYKFNNKEYTAFNKSVILFGLGGIAAFIVGIVAIIKQRGKK